jgi:Type IV pili methyl-accepting chemotaxis transducer N-term
MTLGRWQAGTLPYPRVTFSSEIAMNAKQLKDALQVAEQQLASLRSGKRQPGTYGPPVSSGSGMKVAIDQQLKKIEDLKQQMKKSTKKTP